MNDASREMSLGQFVKQLAASLQKSAVKLPFKNQEPWHMLFYELSKLSDAEGKPKFFDELIFDWDAPYPKCRELSEFLQALHFTASVSARNPSFDAINVDSAVADRWAAPIEAGDPAFQKFIGLAALRAKQEFSLSKVD